MFSSKKFIVPGLMFRSFIHFELFLCMVLDNVHIHSFTCSCSSFPAHLLKRLSFLHRIFLPGEPCRQRSLSSVQWLSRVRLFVTPWTAAHQASLSITNSQSLLKLMSIELVMASNHLILCHPLLLLPSIFPSIRSFQ